MYDQFMLKEKVSNSSNTSESIQAVTSHEPVQAVKPSFSQKQANSRLVSMHTPSCIDTKAQNWVFMKN
jgi:hypothetical protein